MFTKRTKKGFTITELVIVIVVIAILAAVLIPTFASLISKANMSADEQVVRQMNTILAAEEVTDKPSNVTEAKDILTENGIKDFDPTYDENTYYWVGSDNRVLLWTEEEVEEGEDPVGKVTYPKESVKKYKDVTEPSADWSDLSVDYDGIVVNVEAAEGESIRAALLNAVKDAEEGTILVMPKNSTTDLGAGGLSFLGSYMVKDGGTGKALTIDLNGGTIESKTPHSNTYYYGTTIPVGGSLTLVNGKLDVSGGEDNNKRINAFNLNEGSHLVLRDIDLNVDYGDAIFPKGNAAEVILQGCKVTVTNGTYGVATNNRYSDNIHILVNDTIVQAQVPILVNVPSDVAITGSTVIGGGWGVFVRSGHADISNTTIRTTDGDVGTNDSRYNTSCEYFVYNSSDSSVPYWGEGAQAPYAPLVIGDYSNHDSYNHDTDVTLSNVKFENANSTAIPNVVLAARPLGKDVAFNYDDATVVGRTVVFGEGYVRNKFTGLDGKTVFGINHTFKHNGTITVNGTKKDYTGTVTSPIVTKTFSSRYTIPAAAGTFAAYETHQVSELNIEVDGVNILDEFKKFYANQGFELTDAQWATASFAAGSTANSIKTIVYDSSAK